MYFSSLFYKKALKNVLKPTESPSSTLDSEEVIQNHRPSRVFDGRLRGHYYKCRPVSRLLHPLTRVRKFESDIISSERGTDRNPSPFLPVRMCVYGNCVVLLRTVFATAPIVPFDLFQSGSACRIIAIAYAFAVIHERPRRASAPAAAVRRRIVAIAPRFP